MSIGEEPERSGADSPKRVRDLEDKLQALEKDRLQLAQVIAELRKRRVLDLTRLWAAIIGVFLTAVPLGWIAIWIGRTGDLTWEKVSGVLAVALFWTILVVVLLQAMGSKRW